VRRRELLLAAAAAGAGGAALVRPVPAGAQGVRDADVLSRALQLEHVSVFACDAVSSAGVLRGAAADRLDRVREHEAAHVAALAEALRALGPAVPPPPRALGDVDVPQVHAALEGLRGRDDALALLVELERLSLHAYRAALDRLRDAVHLQLVATILAAEASHLVAWRTVR
jgi:ferritin-like protein